MAGSYSASADVSRHGIAVLVVNGKSGHQNRSWMEICLPRLLGFASGLLPVRIFVWNHDYENEALTEMLASFGNQVEVMDERDPAFAAYDGPRYPAHSRLAFHEFHVHRTPLQLLFERARDRVAPRITYVCDSDAWPVRPGWDLRVAASLDADFKLMGVWRDEMASAIAPFVHASGMAFPTSLVEALDLRLDYKPESDREDTLSNFTRSVVNTYGADALDRLKRSNAHAFHGVFGGVYGDWVYHHHLGTRWSDGQAKQVRTKGWDDRKEDLNVNREVMAASVQRAFVDPDGMIRELRFGNHGLSPVAKARTDVIARQLDLEKDFSPHAADSNYWNDLATLAKARGRPLDAAAFRMAISRLEDAH